MGPVIEKLRSALFREELDIHARSFNLLALIGVLVSASAGIFSLQTDELPATVGCFCACLGAVELLLYSRRTGRYKLCYYLTIFLIFIVGFSGIFFVGGGYMSGMPLFFLFAIVFTAFLLEGRELLGMLVLELCVYAADIFLAWRYPHWVIWHKSATVIAADVLICTISSGVALCAGAYLLINQYRRQQKKLEQARREAHAASDAKSIFLANMSHEIRTPIHVIMGINELIRTEAPDPRMREYGEQIHGAGEALRSLVDNILDMSKIEAGKTELHTAPYRTAELLRNLELIGQTRCQAKGLHFTCVKRELPAWLSGDMARVQQIVVNLLGNAVKYTNNGSVTLAVSCQRGEGSEQVRLRIAVSDTGVGIDEKNIPTLFDAFTRGENSTRSHIEGTGLGLAIVKELCRLMGGSVRVESRRGWGSTFTVELPQTIPAAEEMRGPETARTFVAPEGRVLVVDDNEENLNVMRELLRRTQLQVDTVSSGRRALELVESSPYHVILLDYMMPDMDGIETLKSLKALPGFDIPVVALTANAVAGTRERLLEAGFAVYLTKPLSRRSLDELLIRLLPGELVVVTETTISTAQETRALTDRLQPLVRPYQIDLEQALPFFDGDWRGYLEVAELFLQYQKDQREKLGAFQRGGEPTGLVYAVHALKGKAKNLGLFALAEEAEHLERLCREGSGEEARSLLPHLLFLYRRGVAGLELLVRELKTEYAPAPKPTLPGGPEQWRRELPGLLERFQLTPALERIEALMAAEPARRERLTEIHRAVSGIDFLRAAELWKEYEREVEQRGV